MAQACVWRFFCCFLQRLTIVSKYRKLGLVTAEVYDLSDAPIFRPGLNYIQGQFFVHNRSINKVYELFHQLTGLKFQNYPKISVFRKVFKRDKAILAGHCAIGWYIGTKIWGHSKDCKLRNAQLSSVGKARLDQFGGSIAIICVGLEL